MMLALLRTLAGAVGPGATPRRHSGPRLPTLSSQHENGPPTPSAARHETSRLGRPGELHGIVLGEFTQESTGPSPVHAENLHVDLLADLDLTVVEVGSQIWRHVLDQEHGRPAVTIACQQD